MSERHLVLNGFMGVGKSTVGEILASRLNRPLVDLDARVVAEAGCAIPEIFEREGEVGFRQREGRALCAALGAEDCAVIAVGGGALLDRKVRQTVRAHCTLVTLSAQPETLRARLHGDAGRPLWSDDFEELLNRRQSAYADADMQVPTDDRTPVQVAEAVLALFMGGPGVAEPPRAGGAREASDVGAARPHGRDTEHGAL